MDTHLGFTSILLSSPTQPTAIPFLRPFSFPCVKAKTSFQTKHKPIPCVMQQQPPHPPSNPNGPNRSLANLHELTERIADLLHVGSIQKTTQHSPKDAPLGYLSANNHIVVIFGKHLIRDQITVEYAKRIVTLVKQIASGALNPNVICFTGGKGNNNPSSISEAAAGYTFFRGVCEESGVDVSRFDYILEEESRNSKENLINVIEEIRSRYGHHSLSSCHFTLVSSDYHLIRLQEVHRLTPRQSILFPLEVSASTWNCIFAAYPFCVSRDAPTAFLGRAVVLANDLGILLANLNGALEDREFIAKENLHRLKEVFAKMREMYRIIDSRSVSAGGFRKDMRAHAETLELAIHDIRQVNNLLSPLNETGASVPPTHIEQARDLLNSTIFKMRSSMDPDRVLRVHDRLAITEDMVSYVSDQHAKRVDSNPNSDLTDSSSPSGGSNTWDIVNFLDNTSTEFNESSDDEDDKKKKRPTRNNSNPSMSSEVTWQEGTFFKGNGKKITRDGPNLVITDIAMPTMTATTNPKRTRNRRRSVTETDPLPGSLREPFSSTSSIPPTTPRSTQTPSTRTRRATNTTKSRQTTANTKKRKTPTRKFTSQTSSEAA